MTTAAELRKLFKTVPREDRDAHQPWAIRVWRSLSWLERAEQAAEVEDRFIHGWIAFNALYGQLDENNRPASERFAYKQLLQAVVGLDRDGQLAALLADRDFQLSAERLVSNKYLDIEFWNQPAEYEDNYIEKARSRLRYLLGIGEVVKVTKELIDRLYVMRQQLMHGASTKGSKLNRLNLDRSARLLLRLVPPILEVTIRHGMHHPWPAVCYPPVGKESRRSENAASSPTFD